ncbi:MAG: hypothetical protein IJ667_01755 [Synergistaceae bacterium]|nr:hypothetical protein [Synergistaceae bacterium]
MTHQHDYICHTRFDALDMRQIRVLIRRGDHLYRNGDLLYFKDEPVCVWRSLTAKQHFAINDDGLGLARGELIRRLAYDPRGDAARFTQREQNFLRANYSHLLKPLEDVILFNDSFFELAPAELMQLEHELEISNTEAD